MNHKKQINKVAQKRASNYEPKLKINASFDDDMKMLMGGTVKKKVNKKI